MRRNALISMCLAAIPGCMLDPESQQLISDDSQEQADQADGIANNDDATVTPRLATCRTIIVKLGPPNPITGIPIPHAIPVDSSGSELCSMQQGHQGVDVSALQRSLRTCHSQFISIDGDFGPHTKEALVAVQQVLRITADGIYGAQTRRSIEFPSANDPTNIATCERVPL
jgi:peptidoglycan hydrolase-like protein with peptidoglycan-binding domain